MRLDADELIASAESPTGKDQLRRQTEEAFELDIFGAPTFIVSGEMFWGNDRLEHALVWAEDTNDAPDRNASQGKLAGDPA
jgi:2-hydroxychromene-2-carboxylate isomerase